MSLTTTEESEELPSIPEEALEELTEELSVTPEETASNDHDNPSSSSITCDETVAENNEYEVEDVLKARKKILLSCLQQRSIFYNGSLLGSLKVP